MRAVASSQMNGESAKDFQARIGDGILSSLAERGASKRADKTWKIEQPKQSILLVGHGGANATAVEFLLGIEPTPWTAFRFGFAHTSTSTLRAFQITENWVFGLTRHGNLSHLSRDLRSY